MKKMKSNIQLEKNVLSYFLKTIKQFKPVYIYQYIIKTFLQIIQPFISIIFIQHIINELLDTRNIPLIIIYTAIVILGNFIIKILLSVLNASISKNADLLSNYYDMLLSKKNMELDFQCTEDPEFLEQSSKAADGIDWYSGGADGIISCFASILASIITILSVIVLFINKSIIILLLMVLTTFISSLFNGRRNKVEINSKLKMSKISRIKNYIFWEMSDFSHAKDIRLYNASSMILNKAEEINTELSDINKKEAVSCIKYNEYESLVLVLQEILIMVILIILVLIKRIGIGDFNMMSQSSQVFMGNLASILYNIQELNKKCIYANEYIKYNNLTSVKDTGKLKITDIKNFHIEFKNVSFKYPKTDEFILKDVSIKIKAGKRIALVGKNGTGKSTLIKLLCRLYTPNEGEITIGGININEFSLSELYDLYSVVFQDFKLLSFTVKENISCSIDSKDDIVVSEVLKKTGMSEKIDNLEASYDTAIHKHFDENGFEPSGGQEQKLAISRALYKNAPIIILDEPTAALDPIAECEIYENFNSLMQDKTTIFISHRLASCRFCDEIFVLDNHNIAEKGSHDELVKMDGIYANMFKKQAINYHN